MNSIPRTTILALLSNCRNFPFQSCDTSLTCFTIRRIILLISNSIDSSVHANIIYFSFLHFIRVERFYLPFNPNYEWTKFQLSIIHYPSSSVTIPDKCIDSISGDGVDTRIHFFLPDNPFLPRPRVHPSPTRELWILEKEDPFPINTQHRLRCRQGPSPSLLPLDHHLLTASKGERERVAIFFSRGESKGEVQFVSSVISPG